MVTEQQIANVLAGLDEAENANWKYDGLPVPAWKAHWRKKYIAIDCDTSGAFLCNKETGELYNIKGYGTPDHNKKRKADIGNIATVDPAKLWHHRWNYLR